MLARAGSVLPRLRSACAAGSAATQNPHHSSWIRGFAAEPAPESTEDPSVTVQVNPLHPVSGMLLVVD